MSLQHSPFSILAADVRTSSPLADEHYREYQDGAFLDALALGHLKPSLAEFWPNRGPVWDALAWAGAGNAGGVVLVEAKSYPDEMLSKCGAQAEASIEKIRSSILKAFGWSDFPTGPNYWLDEYYQAANRIAHLSWLNNAGTPAWLVNLCFINDPTHPAEKQISEESWMAALAAIYSQLQIPAHLKNRIADVHLKGLPRGS